MIIVGSVGFSKDESQSFLPIDVQILHRTQAYTLIALRISENPTDHDGKLRNNSWLR